MLIRFLLSTLFTVSAMDVAGQVEKFESYGALSEMPFSESVRAGDLLFISGQVGSDISGNLVEGGITPESHQVMRNIRDIIYRRGLTMSDVVKCTVFLADVSKWGDFNQVYTSYFSKPYPARSALGANGLAIGAALEVECIAAYPQRPEPRPINDDRP
jgi:reactive intermediate/imine deaminase